MDTKFLLRSAIDLKIKHVKLYYQDLV